MKTSELTGAALNWAVGVAQGMQWKSDPDIGLYCRSPSGSRYVLTVLDYAVMEDWSLRPYTPASAWYQAGPIIEREWVDLTPWPNETDENMRWQAVQFDTPEAQEEFGPTPLIAAMRCYVASQLGDEVEIPEELCK